MERIRTTEEDHGGNDSCTKAYTTRISVQYQEKNITKEIVRTF